MTVTKRTLQMVIPVALAIMVTRAPSALDPAFAAEAPKASGVAETRPADDETIRCDVVDFQIVYVGTNMPPPAPPLAFAYYSFKLPSSADNPCGPGKLMLVKDCGHELKGTCVDTSGEKPITKQITSVVFDKSDIVKPTGRNRQMAATTDMEFDVTNITAVYVGTGGCCPPYVFAYFRFEYRDATDPNSCLFWSYLRARKYEVKSTSTCGSPPDVKVVYHISVKQEDIVAD